MTRYFSLIIILFSLFQLSSVKETFAQKTTVETVRNVLKNEAEFTSDDLARLEKGEIIVRKLKTESDGEVAFCGALKLSASRDAVFAAFRRAVEKQRKEVSEERGFFSAPPIVADLKTLTIDKSDVGNLKNCKVGDCSWSLSSDFIKRLAGEIDWSASDAEDKAADLVKRFMVENVNNYLGKGDGALMEYNDDPEPLSLAAEQKILLDELFWLNTFAPEFKNYLQNYPNDKLENIEEVASWEKVPVGFKTVIINTHGIFYKKDDGDVRQGLILSKQIYANHYFHSSMSLTGIVSFPKPDETFETYLYFDSHSRAGALTGTMGKLTRVAVDGEAEDKLTTVLRDTRRYVSYNSDNTEESPSVAEDGILKRFVTNKYFILFVIVVVGVVLILWFTRQRPTKK